jgi:hypothetical protein
MRPKENTRRTASSRYEHARNALRETLKRGGWTVSEDTAREAGHSSDLVASRGSDRYFIELKVAPEGRGDRLVPLWSQACLQAAHWADRGRPLAVVAAPRIPRSAADALLEFAEEFAPDVAAGILDCQGLRRFRGAGLEDLDAEAQEDRAPRLSAGSSPRNLFSDLNQWLLKVLLAPEIPDGLLSAPRGRYANAPQLARAADVSVMSAYRLVQQLEAEGFLSESRGELRLVRRASLFSRWQAQAAERIRERPMRLLVGSDARREAELLAREDGACLALFAAADAFGRGFVSGVPPHVYVREFEIADRRKNLEATEPHEGADLFLREPSAPNSVFRGMVERDGVQVCDIIQVWLDVLSHPSRGLEQAELIRHGVLNHLFGVEGESG